MTSNRTITLQVRSVEESSYQRKSLGKTTGLGIGEFVSALFVANEQGSTGRKLTDAEIRVAILNEYPDRPSSKKLAEGKITVGTWRSYYNSGRLTGGKIPKIKSRRWTVDGKVANRYTGRPAA